MKTSVLPDLIGKTILGVVVKENIHAGGRPATQVHLVFDDQTSLEIYSGTGLAFGGGLDSGGMKEARRYLSEVMQVVCEVSIGTDGKIEENKTPIKE